MDNSYKPNWRYRTYQDFCTYLPSWLWQWMVTLTFPQPHLKAQAVNSLRLNWTRKLCTSEKIQVAYFYVLAYDSGHPHLHLLMIGKGQNGNKSLLDVDLNKWESAWPYISKIQVPSENLSVSGYLARHWLKYDPDRLEYDFYNKKLLKREKIN